MSVLPWIQLAAAALSAGAAALLWASPRDRRIKDLESQVDALRELTPLRIRDYLIQSKANLKDYCSLLEAVADEPMRAQLRKLRHQCDYPDIFIVKLPRVNPSDIRKLTDQYRQACQSQGSAPSPRALDLARALEKDYLHGLDQTTLYSDVIVSPGAGADWNEVWQRPDNGE